MKNGKKCRGCRISWLPLFLIFKPIYFTCYSRQGTVSFLNRGIGQGGSIGVLFFYLTLVLGVVGHLFFTTRGDHLLQGFYLPLQPGLGY